MSGRQTTDTDSTEVAYGKHPHFNMVICVESGRTGYQETRPGTDPIARNKELGVSEERAAELIAQALRRTTHFST